MISGALFLNQNKQIPANNIFRKYIKRIVVSYILWSVIYAFFTCKGNAQTFLLNAINGHYHLWFVPMIGALYAATPIFRAITKERKMCEYFLLGTFLLTIIQPTIFLIFPNSAALINHYTWDAQFWTVGYAFYFVLGHYLHEYEFSPCKRICLYTIGFFAWIATILIGQPTSAWFDPFLANIALTAAAFFLLAKHLFLKININRRLTRAIAMISNCTFGIYLIHDLLNMWLSDLNYTALTYNPIWFVLVISIVIFICSFCLIWLIRHFGPARKYLT
jgi:surface polysaccharide O-acyltransferase-like enzyme